MKKVLIAILALFGLNCNVACCQKKAYDDANVKAFAKLLTKGNVVLLDVRTAEEFAEGHLEGALNIDINNDDFVEEAKKRIAKEKKVAVYCRSGRRSANAAEKLTEYGYKVVNLIGGIMEWQKQKMPVTGDMHEVDVFTTKSGKTLRFYALMHASIRICYDGKEIEIDPVSQLGPRTTDYTTMPKADYIFITHEHPDHFDKETIKLLSKDGTKIITNSRCAEMLGYGDVMKNGEKKDLEGFSIEAVPAYNTTDGRQQFHPKGRDNGFILTVDGLRIYIAGDTEDIPEMADIKDIYIAFLPCNQPYTMTTSQLISAARTIKPKVLFPYHYGQTDISTVPEQLKDSGIDVRIRHYE